MIGVLSTSSPLTSLAIFSPDGQMVFEAQELADRRASMALSRMLQEVFEQLPAEAFTGWVADIGPGSFTGTRVAVTMAKTLAWASGLRVAGVSAFELVDPEGTSVIPARRGQVWIKELGQEPRLSEQEAVYAPGPPLAMRAKLSALRWLRPEELAPDYILEPRISKPKTTMGGARPQ